MTLKIKKIHKGRGKTPYWEIEGKSISFTNFNSKEYTYELISDYTQKVKECLMHKKVLVEEIKQFGFSNTLKIAVNLFYGLTTDYFRHYAMLFTKDRDKISISKMTKRIFGLAPGDFKWPKELLLLKKEFEAIIDEEYFKQCKVFIEGNKREISSNKETWTLYWLNGPGLNCRTFEFSKIKSHTIRKEVMLYYRKKLWLETKFRNDKGIAAVTNAMNFLVENCSSIKYCSDITKHDVVVLNNYLEYEAKTQHGNSLKPNSIRKTIGVCRLVLNYLMQYPKGGHPHSYPIPLNNPFEDVKFNNIAQMERNTEIIPEIVYEQLKKYVNELSETHQLLCRIFENTGMRAGEVVGLEEGCVKFNEEYNAWQLKYKVSKTIVARRIKHQSDYNILVIPEDLGLLILKQEKKTKVSREKYKVKNIFINNTNMGHRHSITQGNAFLNALNRVSKKHQIIGNDGELWHFTSRQYRKKLAVDLIENQASIHEIAKQFGHADTRTTKKYYAEVRKMKLAELNHSFFKKKFNIILGEENLKTFSEDERRVLYVDFCLDNREVELGVCIKHFSEGPCGKRSGKSKCVNCKNLCTGVKYLSKWIRLRDSQKQIVDELIRIYKNEGITNYEEFREYQREFFLYRSYHDIAEKLNSWKEL